MSIASEPAVATPTWRNNPHLRGLAQLPVLLRA